MSAFRSLKRDCPVCNGARKDCRQNTLTNLIHCRHSEANPVDYVFRGLDKIGFGIWAEKREVEAASEAQRKEWQQLREIQKQQRLEAEARHRAESLPPAERDRYYRQLLNQLTLHPDDRADLRSRGISEEQIKAWGIKSIERWQKLDSALPSELPGVGLDGRSLSNYHAGYIVPIQSPAGEIVGFQIANRDRSEESPKYPWLTGRNKKRPHGPQPNLPNGEPPLAVAFPSNHPADILWVGLCEGTGVKPRLAAEKLGIPVIGSSGGGFFATSPETLQTYLKAICPKDNISCVLLPDAGGRGNPDVLRSYRKLKDLLATWGYSFTIAWWGQAAKTDPDIDELEAVDYKNIQYISWEKFAGEQFLQSQQNLQAKHPKGEQQLSRDEWQLKHGFPQQLLEIGEFVKKAYAKLTAPRGFGVFKNSEVQVKQPSPQPVSSTAIVLQSQWQQWREAKPSKILYEPGKLLSKAEWQALGCPTIEYQGSDRLLSYKEFYDTWDKPKIYDSSDVGQGKSHSAGLLTKRWLTGDKGRVFYNDVNHRNPSTATVEQNFTDQASRHNGLKYDKFRKTASGFDHVVRPKAGETPDIPGNCPETETFLLLNQDKNLIVQGGKGSPICEKCPHFKGDDGKVSCPFLIDRIDTLKYESEIRQHLAQSVSGQSKEDDDGNQAPVDVFIIEEVGSSLKPYKNVEVSKHDLAHAFQELKQKDAILALIAQPLFDTLYNLMGAEKLPAHGLDFLAVRSQLLPHVPAIYKAASTQLWDKWLTDAWEDGTPNSSLYSFLSTSIRKALTPNLHNLINSNQTPEQKQAILSENVPLNWISHVLDAILENKAHLHIDDVGRLHITRYNGRVRSVMDTYKMVILMDATLSKDELSQLTRIKKSDIVEIRQTRPDFSNLTITLIKGMGSGSKKRREDDSEYSLQNRIQKLTAYIEGLHPDGKTGLIDHQAFHGRCGEIVQAGYWGRDNRGSNQFLECEALILIGTPFPNLGQAAAEFHAETGKVVSPSGLGGSFGRWVRGKVKAEGYQGVGRLRAHLRKHQQLTAYIVANSVVTAAELRSRFPGCKVVEVDVADFCLEAAPKGVQMDRRFIRVLGEAVKNNINVTTAEIAEQLGVVRSRVSQLTSEVLKPLGIKGGFNRLKELLILLLGSNNTKLTPLEELPFDARWIAETYMGIVVEDPPIEAVKEVLRTVQIWGIKTFKQILSATAPDVVEKLLSTLLTVLFGQPELRKEPAG
ncbi:MAG TPA: hypothetical protein V6D12_06670 [Candidatus Obscuribacterales bacterium]